MGGCVRVSEEQTHPGGRPRLYSDPKQFAERVDAYFTEREVQEDKPPTIAGLAYFLGFSDRHALAEYEGYGPEFSATVKRARLKIEDDRSSRLLGKDTFTPGVIFDLKNNHGWKDKSEQELSGPNGGPLQVQEIALRGVRPNDADP